MKNIWKNEKEVSQKLKSANGVLIFLDFDGTLSPIVTNFKDASIASPEAMDTLKKISSLNGVFVMIVSGRKLKSLKEKIDLPSLNYAGNHGLEWIINGVYDRYPFNERIVDSLNEVKKIYNRLSKEYEGIFIEDKSMSLSLHYRNLKNISEENFIEVFYKSVKKIKNENIIEFIEGKKVIDARPKIEWNKGQIVNMVSQQIPGRLTIAIGDDTTDEDMFKKITNGLAIRVGEGDASRAEYYLENIEDVYRFLNYIYKELVDNHF